MRTLRALLRIGRPPRARLALAVALGSVTVLAGVGLMGVAGYLISRSAEHPPVLSLTVTIVAVRAFALARPVSRYFERLGSHDLTFRVLARMRVAFYRTLEPRIPSRAGGFRQGDLLARVVGDVDATQNLFLRGVYPPLVAAVAAIASVTAAAVLLPAAAIVLAVGLALGGIAVPTLAASAGRVSGRRRATARGALTADLVEVLRAAPELAVLGAADAAVDRVQALDDELRRLGRRDASSAAVVEGLGTLVTGLTVVGVLAVCVRATGVGALDRTLVAALALGAMAAFEAVAPLPASALGIAETVQAGARLLRIGEDAPEAMDPADPLERPAGPTAALEAVRFEHDDGETWGLRDVDLLLSPGRRIALVGHSGSGKSTVAALLVRFFDPDAGRVTLGGVDERRLRQADVREVVGLDGQDAYLFASTIRENVRLARPGADDAEIEAALRRARVWDWVAGLPDGLDTFVGTEGALVSGGERRRLALARSFLADRPILVLDEPTAHLDAPTAEALMADVLAAADGRSILLITHRSEGLDAVDGIVELRRGAVVEPPSGVSRPTRPGDVHAGARGRRRHGPRPAGD
jgi:ATP-binding cassette subfamily C protein CydC